MERQLKKILVAFAGGALALTAAYSPAQTDDPVYAAFERMFNHVPTQIGTVHRADDVDPLIDAVVVPIRDWLSTEARASTAAAESGLETVANFPAHDRTDD